MTSAPVPPAFFTLAALVLAVLILIVLRLLMIRSTANLCLSGFLAFVIPSPMMLVAHGTAALVMLGLGLACAIPAYLLAEDHLDDDGRGGGRGPDPVDPEPDPGPDSDLWREFEREFWSHVQRSRELVGV